MDDDEREAASNLLDGRSRGGIVPIGSGRRQRRAIAHDRDASRWRALLEDSIAHVFAEDDDPGRLTQRAAMHLLPAPNPSAWTHNVPADSHVRVEVANVVDK